MKTLRIHNGRWAYQYVLNNKLVWSAKDLIEKLAVEAGYKITYSGNGDDDLQREADDGL